MPKNIKKEVGDGAARWSGTSKNQDVSTGPLARPFAHSLSPLTHSLAPPSSLCSRAPLHSFARSLTSLTPSLMGQWMIGQLFCLCFFLFSTTVYLTVDPTICQYICPNICLYIHLLVCTSCWLTLHQSVWPISLLVELAKASVCHGNGWKDDQHFEWKFLLRRIINLHRKRENQKIKKIRRIKINLGCVWFFSLCKNLPLFRDS